MPRRSEVERAAAPWFSTPRERQDGEMYARPEPHVFSPAWARGYEHAFEGRPADVSGFTKIDVLRYQDGYDAGTVDREEVQRSGSSNT